jgi:hypothetical protein
VGGNPFPVAQVGSPYRGLDLGTQYIKPNPSFQKSPESVYSKWEVYLFKEI